jgi:hypothetical protein
MNKKYKVTLTGEERHQLYKLISSGKNAARVLTHARILLKADASEGGPNLTDEQICDAVDTSRRTVTRVRKCFVEEGFEAALYPHKRKRHRMPKIDGRGEAHLIALSCGPAPEGYARWTLRLLAERFVALGYVDSMSHEAVRQALKKMNLSPG